MTILTQNLKIDIPKEKANNELVSALKSSESSSKQAQVHWDPVLKMEFWFCEFCEIKNAASRDSCRLCLAGSPLNKDTSKTIKIESLMVSKKFASFPGVGQSQAIQAIRDIISPNEEMGEWMCSECQIVNSRVRKACSQCMKIKSKVYKKLNF